jgi:predicted nucleic acid-binding protein
LTWAILDTNVYIDHWERGLHDDVLDRVRQAFIVRHSSVVLSELRRGARTPSSRQVVDELFRLAHLQWSPTAEDWWEAGRLVRQIGDDQGWDLHKRRDFQNDALIALTARRHGATIVTADRTDYELLAPMVPISIMAISN